jgi:peptidoglycan/xylan/chitin deacetylase (PgdA/CDA1 family)
MISNRCKLYVEEDLLEMKGRTVSGPIFRSKRPSPDRFNQEANLQPLHLLYHSLSQQPRSYSYELSAQSFERHVRLCRELSNGEDGGRMPVFTFDDGHVSNYEYALPILSDLGFSSFFFVTVDWIGTPQYMTWQQVRTIQSAGHEIGSHTLSHPMLTHCSDEELAKEIGGSKDSLENQLGAPIRSISFPGGRYNRRVVEACEKAGYFRFYTSDPYSRNIGDVSLTGRISVHNSMDLMYMRDLISNNKLLLLRMRASFATKQFAQRLLGDRLYWKLWRLITHYPD